ncbi:MAG: hypothetical protein N4A33_05975 [Bacteriovoracaceae bacterium]|jgi:hypothetical protein|nr:hypothetical protein [Bacteriovoracaceae bacterium]
MTKTERKIFDYTNIIIFIIGLVYFILKYFFKIETAYGVRPHPFTSIALHLHIITVPFLTISLGYLLKAHILEKLKFKYKRSSGITILILFILMTFGGYLLQINPSYIDFLRYSHIIISFVWVAGYFWHR